VSVQARVNGELRELAENLSLASLLEQAGAPGAGRGCAIALDGEVVPRSRWASTPVPDGAAVEIVVAVQGG
jgi:sulfur carrier protein